MTSKTRLLIEVVYTSQIASEVSDQKIYALNMISFPTGRLDAGVDGLKNA